MLRLNRCLLFANCGRPALCTRYSGFRASITALATMSQVPGAASPENSLSLHDKLSWLTLREAHGRKEGERGSGDKLGEHAKNVGRRTYSSALGTTSLTKHAQHGKNVEKRTYSSALGTTSLMKKKTLEDNLKEDAGRDTILEMLHEKNYEIDFHGYTCPKALKELQDIITNLTHNMKGKSKQQFTVITGKGNHTPNGKPKILLVVLDYLEEKKINYKKQENNSGRINIIV